MNPSRTMEHTKMVAPDIPGYNYGAPGVAKSPINAQEFESLKQSAGFNEEDIRWLRVAGDVLFDQTKALIGKWREVVAAHPHLAKYSQTPEGEKDPHYSEVSRLRFQQWILDTCFRPYDQDWLNYQQEIALRHTNVKKNKTDNARSLPTIHLRHIIAFGAVVNDPNIMKPFLSAKGNSAAEVEKMHQAWSKSLWLQIALWTEPYTNVNLAPNEW